MTRFNTWQDYFAQNLIAPRPRIEAADLPSHERDIVLPSLAEFQLGETSAGHRLLALTTAEARAGRVPAELVPAMAQFIAEERRHAAELANFLQLNDQPLVHVALNDALFRLARHMHRSLAASVAVMLLAEVVALAYYAALRRYTASPTLKQICRALLKDEVMHLAFHREVLAAVMGDVPAWQRRLLQASASAFAFCTCLAVWRKHAVVLQHGQFSFASFWAFCDRHYAGCLAQAGLSADGAGAGRAEPLAIRE